jgi:integrase/recombinase XerD
MSSCSKSNRCLPLSEWPDGDQAAWAAALIPGDPFEPGGVAAGWSVATRGLIINGYGRYLTWLQASGLYDLLAAPAARVSAERLEAYAADLRKTTSEFSVAARIQQLGNALRALAPDQNWRWIQRAADRIRARAVPVRDKRPKLKSPAELVALGMHLMTAADTAVIELPNGRAKAYRDGLIIALLALRPIRARNLASIRCERHLVRRGKSWWLIFEASETKTHRTLEMPFPPELVSHLERYLAVYRPVLLARGHRRRRPATMGLWISSHGTQMTQSAIAYQIGLRTKAVFGTALNPHLFRDCAATEIAISASEQVEMIRPILGHATLATSERHYNQAGSLEASRRYSRTLAALRQPPTKLPPRRSHSADACE